MHISLFLSPDCFSYLAETNHLLIRDYHYLKLSPPYLSLTTMTTTVRSLSTATVQITVDGAQDAKQNELHNYQHEVHIEFEKFYGMKPTHVDRRFDLTLSDLTYLPRVTSCSFLRFQQQKLGSQTLMMCKPVG